MQSFDIRPNNSLSQRGLIWGALGLGLVLGLFAARLAWMGFWLVIPFLMVDFLAVGVSFYLIRKRCRIRESIQIDEKQLLIQHHELRREKIWSFDLHWVSVKLQQHEHPWQASRLLVGSHGKWIELANFLTNEERASLSSAIKQSIQEQKQYA